MNTTTTAPTHILTEINPDTGLPERILEFAADFVAEVGGMKKMRRLLRRPHLTRRYLEGDDLTHNGFEEVATPRIKITAGHIFG